MVPTSCMILPIFFISDTLVLKTKSFHVQRWIQFMSSLCMMVSDDEETFCELWDQLAWSCCYILIICWCLHHNDSSLLRCGRGWCHMALFDNCFCHHFLHGFLGFRSFKCEEFILRKNACTLWTPPKDAGNISLSHVPHKKELCTYWCLPWRQACCRWCGSFGLIGFGN